MIVICDKAQDVIIPAGLGDNPGVVYEKSGVESLNGQQGDLTLKTVNGNELLGEGDVAIDTGVESLNGQKGALTLKTVNGNELTGEGNIEIQAGVESVNGETGAVKIKSVNGQSLVGDGDVQIQAGLKYFELTADKAKEAYDEVANHWDDKSGYTGDYVFRYKKENGGVYTFDEMGYIKDHSISFSWLDNVDAYSMDGNVKCFSIIIWKESYEFSTYENNYTIPTKVSQLTNDSDFQTKAQVDTAIENAISGGNQNVIVLDGLTQEERKAIYDKLDKTKPIDAVFVYNNSTSIRTAWDGRDIYFYCITENENGIKYQAYYFSSDGTIGGQAITPNFTNSLIIQVNEHINESDNFNCGYTGSFQNYLVEPFTRPNAYFILFKKGYGANTKSVYAPFTAVWDKDFVDNNYQATPVTIQFTIDGITYKYRNDLTNQNTWQYDGKISMYDSHSINGYNGTSLVLGGAALDATDINKYVAIRSMMGYDTIFNGDNDGSCPYLTITTTDSQMYKVPVVVKCNKQNDSATRATFEFDLNGYHYLYTQDNQGDLTFSFTSKTQIANINSDEVSNIKVLTQSEYDALEPKDPHTMYCIKGQ